MSKKTSPLSGMWIVLLLVVLVEVQFSHVFVSASPADLNRDGIVDMEDLFIVSDAYGSYPGDPNWNAEADLNNDVLIDMIDVTLVAIEYQMNRSVEISSYGGHSANWSPEERSEIYEGLIEPPDIYVSYIWWAPSVSTIHEKHPDKKIIIYRNFRKVERSRTEEWASRASWRLAEYEFARENNVICKDSAGNSVYSRNCGMDYLIADIGNPKWHQFIADWVKFYIDNFGFDGVLLDNGLAVREDETYWGVSAKPINPRTGTHYTSEEVVQYHIQVQKKIREVIGNDKLIICNGIYHGERFFEREKEYSEILNQDTIDGVKSEGIFGGKTFWNEERWRKSVEFIRWIQENWLTKGKIFIPHLCWHRPETSTNLESVWVGFEDGYTLEHSLTFYFASTLLGIDAEVSESNFLSLYGYWHEPFAQKLFSLNLGEPSTEYYRVEDTHVYARKFQKGLVVVNPAASSCSVSFEKEYQTLTGKVISSLNLDQYEGVILLKP